MLGAGMPRPSPEVTEKPDASKRVQTDGADAAA
jgi:hypothetical protein